MVSPHVKDIVTRVEGEAGKHKMWAGQFFSLGAYTIFRHTRAENNTFAFLSRERKGYFRPGYGEEEGGKYI